MKTKILLAGLVLLGSLGPAYANESLDDNSFVAMKDVSAEQMEQLELANVEGKGRFCFACYGVQGSSTSKGGHDGDEFWGNYFNNFNFGSYNNAWHP